MATSALLVQFNHQHLVGRNGELVKGEDGTLLFVSGNHGGVVIGTERENDLLLNGCTFHHFFIHNFNVTKSTSKGTLRMEIEQPVVGVQATQQILDAESLAADVLDVSLVVLMDGLHDQSYQLR